MTESTEIQERIREFADWLHTVRVSQDGWAKVVDRIATDASDAADALCSGKIVAHIPAHLKKNRKNDEKIRM